MLAGKETLTKPGQENPNAHPPRSTPPPGHVLMTDLRLQREQNQFIHRAVVDDSTFVSVPWFEGLRIEGVLRIREMAELQRAK